MANVLMVVAPQDFRDEEYFKPRAVLEQAGHHITVASTQTGELKGVKGGLANADITVKDANANDFETVIFVGGNGSEVFQGLPEAEQLIKDTLAQGKLVNAICLAPIILAKAGVLKGVNATCTPGAVEDLKSYGANYVDEGVVKDGQFITADGPQSATAFGQAIATRL